MIRDVLAWALATELVGLAILPLLRSFFDNRRDAALLSRPIGLAVVAYVGWALSLATPLGFRRLTLLLALAAVAGASYLFRRRAVGESAAGAPWWWWQWGDEEKLGAILFWASTGVFLLIRAAGPAILGAEKFMDLAFLNSLARFPAMPPADPWMAGKTINYYYWGYLLAAAQAQLSGVAPMTAYNLSVASFAGFSFAAAASLGLRLSRGRLGVGLAAGAGAVFAGNLAGALDAWNAPFAADFDYWHASRVIGPDNLKTINEFPFFTFFHADLHPHLLAFPFFIAAFVVAHRWVEIGSGKGLRAWPSMLLVALVAGTARAANFWNLPAMAILLVGCGVFLTTRGERVPGPAGAVIGGLAGVAALFASWILFYPYTSSFQLTNNGLGRTTMFSGLIEFAGVWGILFAVLRGRPLAALGGRLGDGRAPPRPRPRPGRRGRARRRPRAPDARHDRRAVPGIPRRARRVEEPARRRGRGRRRLRRIPGAARARDDRRLRARLLQGQLRRGPAAHEHDLQVLPPGLAPRWPSAARSLPGAPWPRGRASAWRSAPS